MTNKTVVRISPKIMTLRLIASIMVALVAPATWAQPDEYSYRDFVKYSHTSRVDKELQAFVQGVSYVLRVEFVCDGKATELLRNPPALIEELLRFASTDWGKLYLETEGSFGVARYPMTVGDVMYKYFTQYSKCQRIARPK